MSIWAYLPRLTDAGGGAEHYRNKRCQNEGVLPHVSRTRAPAGAFVLSFVFTVTCGCGGSSSPAGPTPPNTDPLVGFTLTGDAASQGGATWTYVAQVSGTSYDRAACC